jgi:hypothetical protein
MVISAAQDNSLPWLILGGACPSTEMAALVFTVGLIAGRRTVYSGSFGS